MTSLIPPALPTPIPTSSLPVGEVNLSTWEREQDFNFFIEARTTVRIAQDFRSLSRLISKARFLNLRPFPALSFCIMYALNLVPALRLCIPAGSALPYMLESRSASIPFIDLSGKRPINARCEFDGNFAHWYTQCVGLADAARSGELGQSFDTTNETAIVSYVRTDATSIFMDTHSDQISMPVVFIGKSRNIGGEEEAVSVSLTAHHALCDGGDMADFFWAVEKAAETLLFGGLEEAAGIMCIENKEQAKW